MVRKKYKISGMHCTSCAMMIEGDLEDAGAKSCRCSYIKQELEVEFDEIKLAEEQIKKTVAKSGYKIVN